MTFKQFLVALGETTHSVRWYVSPTGMIRGEKKDLQWDKEEFLPKSGPSGRGIRVNMCHSPITAVYGYLNYANTYSDTRVAHHGLGMSKPLATRIAAASLYSTAFLGVQESQCREKILEALGLNE